MLEATDGSDALQICQQCEGQIELVLTDLVMPLMSGPALTEKLKGLYPGLGLSTRQAMQTTPLFAMVTSILACPLSKSPSAQVVCSRRFAKFWTMGQSTRNLESRHAHIRVTSEFLPCGCNCGEAKKSFCSDKGPTGGRLAEGSLSEVDDKMA